MITIGQLAAYADVTIKAVRHYHQRGLLPEPPRDASGYRRYDARHAVTLVQIATLARAGVPLARVKELLAADPEEFTSAIATIDQEIQTRIEELRDTRERLAKLGAADQLFVNAEVAEYLQRLRDMGVSERGVRMERDAWIVLQAADPAIAEPVVVDKLRALDDPEFCAICLEYDKVYHLRPDDPRVEALAHRTVRWFATRPADVQPAWHAAADPDTLERLLSSAGESSPAWDRIAEIVAEGQRPRPPVDSSCRSRRC